MKQQVYLINIELDYDTNDTNSLWEANKTIIEAVKDNCTDIIKIDNRLKSIKIYAKDINPNIAFNIAKVFNEINQKDPLFGGFMLTDKIEMVYTRCYEIYFQNTLDLHYNNMFDIILNYAKTITNYKTEIEYYFNNMCSIKIYADNFPKNIDDMISSLKNRITDDGIPFNCITCEYENVIVFMEAV